jgi:NAD(P)H-hydrate epimerase
MQPLVTAAEMREMDRLTIEEIGIPGVVLMELAGRGVADVVESLAGTLPGYRVVVVAGPGNNGGDGYVVARHLALRGAEVTVLLAAPRERVAGDARVNLLAAEHLGLTLEPLPAEIDAAALAERLARADCLVDALLGTGLASPVEGRYRAIIEALNLAGVLTVAVDIPSGLSADTGHPLGVAVEADATVTFAYPKVGLATFPGVEHVGDLHVVDIGIPPHLPGRLGVRCHLLREPALRPLLPGRRPGGHKGTYGHALIVAGSTGKTGAAVLCAEAAQRAGAGLVTLAVPASLQATLPLRETMSEAYCPDEATLDADRVLDRLRALAAGKQALAIGPGLSPRRELLPVIQALVHELEVPVVLDADGLNLVATDPQVLAGARAPLLLTPHPGEAARLLGCPVREVQADRCASARRLATEHRAWVALKGARTVVATPAGDTFINPTGNPGMGSGGMGDVLTGLLVGLLAQAVSPADALPLAVYLHGLAADEAASRRGEHGLVASDVIDALPAVMLRWTERCT